MKKLFAILPATVLSACVSMGAWAQSSAATPAATPVTPAVAASAAGVKPVEVKPAVVNTAVPAATPPAPDKLSTPHAAPAPTAKAKSPTPQHAKAGHKSVHPKAAKASMSSGAAIK